ncbi:MAG: helix-turn-helix transcriptional regulator [Chloroflexota bacterium]
MPRRAGIRAAARLEGARSARAVATMMGNMVLSARERRHWARVQLGVRVGLSATRIGQIERGDGAGVSLEVWFALAAALDMPLNVAFGRDPVREPDDAGHLKIQELMLRLARLAGRHRTFELATRPASPSFSIDVGVRDDALRVFFIEECWNTFGSINGAVRSTRRKIAEAEQLAVATGGEGAYGVAAVWIVRDTRRNREIVTRYPEVFTAAFTGSSRLWVQALTQKGVAPPTEPGLVWCDVKATRLFAWRKS